MEETWIFKDFVNQIKKRVILNSYYTKKIKDGKTIYASILDWIFITFIIILFFLITILNSTKNILISILFTSIIVGLYLAILIVWKSRIRGKKIIAINDDLADKQIIKEISKYSNRDFLLYAKDLLEKNYETTFFEYDSHIDFIGEINEEIYGIKCIKRPLDNFVTLKNLEYYIKEMENKKIQEGIIVTSSYFTDEVREKTNYILIDYNQIKEILIKTRSYPTKEEIEELIVNRYKDRRRVLKSNLSFNRKDIIYKFILLGIVLYIVSSYVAYPLYYKIMAIILFLVGMIIGAYNLIKYLKITTENNI